ncbi:SCAN domain-containing protein 3 [Eumeta japonica]|uniref:SCAN domain-containing protein 3 n=1 Tax=Eumeta variegata TaxID=151549 RepID=A0A4C1XSX3_EUMVA|nr:SCAN domain-containing protein 3 [Eumeta japonica]
MFSSMSRSNDDGLRASYNISLLIAKSGKPHTIGEQLILPAVEEVLKTVLHKTSFEILKRIPLRNNTVQRRIDEISSDVESFLCDYLQTPLFSIQVDESTLPGNEALLLAYVRFVMGEEIHEELLFAKTLKTDTKTRIFSFQIVEEECLDEDIQTYVEHLITLHDDFKFRFEDILTMEIPPWIINLFHETKVENVILQEELLELSTNEELKMTFKKGYQKFWLQFIYLLLEMNSSNFSHEKLAYSSSKPIRPSDDCLARIELEAKDRRVRMLVGRGTPESRREFRRWWRSYKGQERKMWFKTPSSRLHSHTDESLMLSLARKRSDKNCWRRGIGGSAHSTYSALVGKDFIQPTIIRRALAWTRFNLFKEMDLVDSNKNDA